jgi:hypothetical protein
MVQFYLPEKNRKEVEQLAQRLGVPRSAAVRLAVSRMLTQIRKQDTESARRDDGVGLSQT